MTLAALAETVGGALASDADSVEKQKDGHKIVYKATVGKQAFLVTCEELAPDRQDPPST